MITLEFKGSTPLRHSTLGPARRFRVAGNFIRDADTGNILARYHNHFWDVNGQHYTGYECKDAATLRFADAEGGSSDAYGPFPGLYVADGSVYGNDKLVAKFVDQTLLWHDHQADAFWPNMFVECAAVSTSPRP
jgi:hypothetical protein